MSAARHRREGRVDAPGSGVTNPAITAKLAEDLRRGGCHSAALLVERLPLADDFLLDAIEKDLEFGSLGRRENNLILALLKKAAWGGAEGEERILAAYVAWESCGCLDCANKALDPDEEPCGDCIDAVISMR